MLVLVQTPEQSMKLFTVYFNTLRSLKKNRNPPEQRAQLKCAAFLTKKATNTTI